MKVTICTLVEKHFHHGVCALANSLVANGYEGDFWIGYRGEVPKWTREQKAGSALRLHWEEVTTSRHFTNYKADWMLHLLNEKDTTCDALLYLDPDIVVNTRWAFFENWLSRGLAICQDINPAFPSNHPIRLAWQDWLKHNGFDCSRRPEVYYNAGCLGLRRADKDALSAWQVILNGISAETEGLGKWSTRDRSHVFGIPDQDAFNMMIMATSQPISSLGPEAMAFFPGFAVLPHAVGASKPWAKAFLREAIGGRPPTMADKAYLKYAGTPYYSMPAKVLAQKRLRARLAAALGRLYRRA